MKVPKGRKAVWNLKSMDMPGDPSNNCADGDHLQFTVMGMPAGPPMCGQKTMFSITFRGPKRANNYWLLKAVFKSDIFEQPPHLGFHSEIYTVKDDCHDDGSDEDKDDDEDDPSTYECGLAPFFPTGGPAPPSPGPSMRIIGGDALPPGAIPWIAAIYPTHGANFSKDSFSITGALITDRHILTVSPFIIGYKPENVRVRS